LSAADVRSNKIRTKMYVKLKIVITMNIKIRIKMMQRFIEIEIISV